MSIFHNKKYPRLWKIHRFPLAFSENHCYYSVKAVAGRLDCPPAAAFCNVEVAIQIPLRDVPVSYTHLRAHETDSYLVCRLLLEKKNQTHETRHDLVCRLQLEKKKKIRYVEHRLHH